MQRRLIIAILSVTVGASAEASPILDQSHYPSGDNGFIVELTQSLAQSFTVGISGTLVLFTAELARVEAPAPSAGIDWELRELDTDGRPEGSLLASGTLDPDDIGLTYSFIPIDLSPFGIKVKAGDEYVMLLSSLAEPTKPGGGINPYAWHVGGDYPFGNEFVKRPPFDWSDPQPGLDLGFETFVPEPASTVLFVLALGAGLSRRRVFNSLRR